MAGSIVIKTAASADVRFELKSGAGSDAVHQTPVYAYAVCRLKTSEDLEGIGLAFTLGLGNDLVCQAINYLSRYVVGKEIEDLMSDYGTVFNRMSDDPNLRWLGPHKGVVHLALASITNACFDLWAKARGLPLWKLLCDLSPESLVNTMDLSYLEDVLTREEAISIVTSGRAQLDPKSGIINTGYPGYDTSVGWFNYSDEMIIENVKRAIDSGFTAMKLKVGSKEMDRDIRRAHLVREIAGKDATLMLDANQQWNLPQAITICKELVKMDPYWIEEPTHPDDISGHVSLSNAVNHIRIAVGEHIPNRILFKNFILSGCMRFNQVDCVRVGGISEFMSISLLSKKYNIPVVPHVGDMGQIHQHLVLFNHLILDHPALFLEYIPHLKDYFKVPARVEDGYYMTPQEPGSGSDLLHY